MSLSNPVSLLSYEHDPVLPDTLQIHSLIEQWRQLRLTFDQLLNLAPSARKVIEDVLGDTFKVDPARCGLLFDGSSRLLTLTQLSAYVRHHPSAPADLDRCATVHAADSARLYSLRPSELYALLARLDLPRALRQHWERYWDARLKGTPSSRREHAEKQYRLHFQVTLDTALAIGRLGDGTLHPVLAMLENPEWFKVGHTRIILEGVGNAPGALVISLESKPAQVLYDPRDPDAFKVYPSREALNEALQGSDGQAVTYTDYDDLAMGCTALLDSLLQDMVASLDVDPGDDIKQHAYSALSLADRLKERWAGTSVFAAPPAAPAATENEDSTPSLFELGWMGSDVPARLRLASISRHLHQITQLSNDQATIARQHQKTLDDACRRARTAIDALLISAAWHSDAKPFSPSLELLEAHRDGLRTHARFQHLLQQIDAQALARVEALLDANHEQAVAAQLVIHLEPEQTGSESPHTAVVPGALVILEPSALDDNRAQQNLLLYWIGESGGLLSCTGRTSLADCLGIALAPGSSLELQVIEGDALHTILTEQVKDCRKSRQDIQDTQGIQAAAAELPRLKETLAGHLQVPGHKTRAFALDLLDKHDETLQLAGATAQRLARIPADTRQSLKLLTEDYLDALHKNRGLIRQSLPERKAFCLERINRQLKQDFDAFTGTAILVDLPVSTRYGTGDVVSGSGAPGTPIKGTLKPSAEREELALETLLLENIDDPMRDRLQFMQLKAANSGDDLPAALVEGMTPNYLWKLSRKLDLAEHYETAIRDAFIAPDETDFQQAYRRECLVNPYRLMLKLQNLLFKASGHLDDTAHRMVAIGIDANSNEAFKADGFDLRLLPAVLTSGGPDTKDQPTTLLGVTFIEDRASKVTVLYLPEHPTAPLSRYASLEAARSSLYHRSKDSRESDYLTARALTGDPRAHRSRIAQAHQHDFKGIIGIGTEWPATTSLAHLQLNAHMGRLIQAHRDSSRSNLDLHVENLASHVGKLLLGFKITLGIIPFIGLPISVYDAFDASRDLVKAIRADNDLDLLDAIQNVLVAGIDIALEALGGGVIVNANSLRRATKLRQLRTLPGDLQRWSQGRAVATARMERFAGYEYPHPLVLGHIRPGRYGQYRGVYHHTDGDFIQHAGQIYQVEWDTTAHTWRLKGTSLKGWKRAIALDDSGQWDTHFALYGTHLRGGGGGGGQVLGRIADHLDPYWPPAIRDRLPRILVDRLYRQHRRLTDAAYASEQQVQASIARSNALDPETTPFSTLEAAYQADVDFAKQNINAWEALLQVSQRRNRQAPAGQKQRLAALICHRLHSLIALNAKHSRATLVEMAALRARLADLSDFAAQQALRQDLRKHAVLHLQRQERMFKYQEEVETWFALAERDATLQAEVTKYRGTLNQEFKAFFATHHLMIAAVRYKASSVVAEYLLDRLSDFETDILRTRETLIGLRDVRVNAQQRRQIYEQARGTYLRYKRHLQSAYASSASLFDDDYLQRLYLNLDTLIAMSDKQLQRLPGTNQTSRTRPRSPRLFLATDEHLHIGDYQPAEGGRPAQIIQRDEQGSIITRFESAGGRWRPTTPPRRSRPNELQDLRQVANQALGDLPAYRNRIQAYQRQGMLAADLEHMMVIKAQALENYASRLAHLAPNDPQPAHLIAAAQALRAEGRTMRIAKVKQTSRPAEGHLDYLVDEKQVVLRRVGERRLLQAGDYLQEYVILDATDPDLAVLWYAHFHYPKPDTPFTQFSAAHLKLPSDRYRGPQWQQNQAENVEIWRGSLSTTAANRHFALP